MSEDIDVETSVERVDMHVGTIFDKRFRVEERIATGGFGAIYRATHVKSGHVIALKVLLPSLAQDLGVVARFRREGDTLTALRSPHTISAYELGQASDRTLFITMELLYGESLFERYKANGPFEWKRMVKIGRQVCESLEEAHEKGIVHRDLKPTNIHLEKNGDDIDFVKVLDFGIAKILRGSDFDSADITNAGQMIGTIDYMSPEQMVGAKVTGQTDIYTLGIVMYEMIAGCTPFGEALTAAQALAAVMKGKPEPLYLRAPVPEELDRIVMKCLERDTKLRYQNVTELRLDLARLLAGVVPDRSHVIETKPIERPQLDDATQFTPPPQKQKLIEESRRARRPSDEHTAFTPPPEALLEEMRTHSPAVEWTDDDEYEPTVGGVAPDDDDDDEYEPTVGGHNPRSTEEHERVTKVARLADIAAAAQRGGDEEQPTARADESERVTKVARFADIAGAMTSPSQDEEQATIARLGAPRDGNDNERMTSVARSQSRAASDNERIAPARPAARDNAARGPGRAPSESEPTAAIPRPADLMARMPRGDASERAMTMPRNDSERATALGRAGASDRAMTMPRDGRDANERAMTMPRDDNERVSATVRDPERATAQRGRSQRAASPVRADSAVEPTPPLARRTEDRDPREARRPDARPRKESAVPPVPPARPGSRTAPPPLPGLPAPPRTFTPQNAPMPPGVRPQGSAPALEPAMRPLPRQADTPVPQLVAAPFSQQGKSQGPAPSASSSIPPLAPPPNAARSGSIPPPLATTSGSISQGSFPQAPSPGAFSQTPMSTPGSLPSPLSTLSPVPGSIPQPLAPQVPSQPGQVLTPPGMLQYAPTVPARGPYMQSPSYPPQSPSYPPQSPSYPPQPPSYPSQSYPSQSYPSQPPSPSYPTPAPSYPSASYPPQASPSPSYPSNYPSPYPYPAQAGPPQTSLGLGPYAQQPQPQPGAPLGVQPYISQYPQAPRVDLAPQQRATKSFDMGQQAAREAALRKWIWIIVLIIAAIGGIVLATQL